LRGFVPTPPQVVDLMVSLLFRGRRPRTCDQLLDPGCGTGAFVEGIVRWCKSELTDLPSVVGIESEPARAKEAKESFRPYRQVEIRCADFLIQSDKKFDFIIGNPPYVSILGLTECEKRDFRTRYETAHGRFDLYLLFFERALKSLNPGGRMVFITPEKFLYVETAAPLRRLLGGFEIEEIRLEDEHVFNGLVTYPTITVVANRTPSKVTLVRQRDGTKYQCVLSRDGTSWMPLIRGGEEHASRRLALEDVCLRVSCGVATGADAVFVRKTQELEPQLAAFARPTISGRELNLPGEIGETRNSMLVPYTETGSLIDEDQLGVLGDYLRRHSVRGKLLKRTCVRRKPWYAFHETPPLPEILRPKILCKDITQRPHFWIDRAGNLVPRHSVYYVVPNDSAIINPLCAYLNSTEAADWLAEHCQRAANGFLRLQANVLKAMPVPANLGMIRRKRHSPKRRDSHAELPRLPFPEAAR
jgi:adenine-specific DNA-methyltransferase